MDEAIEKGLAYLAKSQEPAGSFSSPSIPGDTGVSSLCVLAFLAKGHTPGNGRYGELLNKGIDYVLSCQQQNGLLLRNCSHHGPMYSHCISTLMLAEVSGMVDAERQKKIDVVLAKALKLILDAQRIPKAPDHAGGWRYAPDSHDSDLSLTGWAVMALRAARLNGAPVPKEAVDNAVAYVLKNRRPDGGFSYMPGGGSGPALAGASILCLELCGHHGHEATKTGGDYILKTMPTSLGNRYLFFYQVYYCSQAMFQLGGKYWEAWAPRMYDVLLASQLPDGSWPTDSHQSTAAAPTYSTAMAVLAMGVPYQQLPIYQR